MVNPGANRVSNLDVSVIIPVYGQPELHRCLRVLCEQLATHLRGEILLVDNNPEANESLRATCRQFHDVTYLHEPDAGSYRARNRGIAHARGDSIAFTDADCLPGNSWLTAGLQALSDGADVVAGKVSILAPADRTPNAVEQYEAQFAFRQAETVSQHGYGVTANLFARRSLFQTLGKFDQDLLSGGDLEWCNRAAKDGFQICYGEQAEVAHPPRSSLGELLRKGRRVAGGQVMLRQRVPLLAPLFSPIGVFKSLLPPLRQYRQLANSGDIAWSIRLGVAGVATLNKYNISLWRLIYLSGLSNDLERQ